MFRRKKKQNPTGEETPRAESRGARKKREAGALGRLASKAWVGAVSLAGGFFNAFPVWKVFLPLKKLRTRKALGVQLGAHTAVVALVRKGPFRTRLLKGDILHARPNWETPGDGGMEGEGMAAALADYLRKNRARRCLISVGLGKEKNVIFKIDVPPVDDRNLAKIVQLEVQRRIPAKPNQMTYDYEKIDSGPKKNGAKSGVLIAAAANDVLNREINILAEARISPAMVTLSSLALARALKTDATLPHKDGFVAININHEATEICLIQHGTAVLAFKSKINAGKFHEAAQRQLGMERREAEAVVRQFFSESSPPESMAGLGAEFNQYIRVLASEIQTAAHFSASAFHGQRTDRVTLAGEGANWPRLGEEIEKLIKARVKVVEPPRHLRKKLRGKPDFYPRLAASYGLALEALDPPGRDINLAYPKTRAQRVKTQNLAQKRIALGLTAIFLLAANFGYELKLDRLRLEELDRSQRAKMTKIAEASEIQGKHKSLKKELDDIQALWSQRKEWLAALEALSIALPREVTVTNLSLIGDSMSEIGGTTTSLDANLPQLLESTSCFLDVEMPSSLERMEIDGQTAYKFSLKGKIDWEQCHGKTE